VCAVRALRVACTSVRVLCRACVLACVLLRCVRPCMFAFARACACCRSSDIQTVFRFFASQSLHNSFFLKKCGEVKDSVISPRFFLLHKLHHPISPPCLPSRPPARGASGSIESLTLQNLHSPLPSPSAHPSTHPP